MDSKTKIMSRRNVMGGAAFALGLPFLSRMKSPGLVLPQGQSQSSKHAVLQQLAMEGAGVIGDIKKHGGKMNADHAKRFAIVQRSVAAYGSSIQLDQSFQTILIRGVQANGRDAALNVQPHKEHLTQKFRTQYGLEIGGDIEHGLSMARRAPWGSQEQRGQKLDSLIAGTDTMTGHMMVMAQALDQLAASGTLAVNGRPPSLQPAALRQDPTFNEWCNWYGAMGSWLWEMAFWTCEYGIYYINDSELYEIICALAILEAIDWIGVSWAFCNGWL